MKKIALITGGTRGIGYGIARCLAREGYDLAVDDIRDENDVTVALQGLRDMGSEVIYCRADISDPEARKRMLNDIREAYGQLNVLVNNAGVAPTERKDILQTTEESFERLIRINLQGPFFLTQAAANWMIEQKNTLPDFTGCIINITSISSTVASPDRGEYCISKAGLSMASRLWTVRLGEFGIPVYDVRPGVIMTDMTAPVKEKYDKLIAEGLTLQARWGEPDDIGRVVAALVRGDLAYSTGQVIMVDGGLTVPRL
ncbi:MAG: 3-ketoacyl-ACP reductase [Fidelibacterota bacterium]|nr:MAG: 3-ketoacyl-ACP reductase [Candidatus Neomarinimicrobiota bacterium]